MGNKLHSFQKSIDFHVLSQISFFALNIICIFMTGKRGISGEN